MNCHETQNLLHAYKDGELDLVRSLEVEEHIQACPDCRQLSESLTGLKETLSANAPYFTAPDELRKRIAHSVHSAAPQEKSGGTLHWQWNAIPAGLAMAACLALGFFLASQ